MPLLRYFIYVGSVLLALLFVAGAYLPTLPSPDSEGPALPVIHLYAERRVPERLVYDTSAPMPAPAAKLEAGPAQAAVVDVSSRVRDAFAQLPPSGAAAVRSAEPKKPEAPQQPRKTAKRHTAPPMRMVYRQPQFGWFGPQRGDW